MDFDLNFGRFFGSKIELFRKSVSSEMRFPQEILNSKKRDFPEGKCYILQNRRFLLRRRNQWKIQRKQKKRVSKSTFVSTCIFSGFWSQLGWILAAMLRLKISSPRDTFSSCVQEASKRGPRGSKSIPRASQELPTASQEGPRAPKSTPRAPKRAPRGAKSDPRGPQERPRGPQELQKVTQELLGCAWLCLAVFGCTWLCLAVLSCAGPCLAVLDYAWLCLIVLSCAGLLL